MANIVYEVVEHDGGWAYKVGDVFSERFDSHDEARQAADDAAARHELSGETEVISFQDEAGDVRVEVAAEDGLRTTDGGGGVTLVSLDSGGRGVFTVTATVGQTVDLTLAPPTVLVGPNGTIDVLDFRMNGLAAGGTSDTRVAGASGLLTVGVGGRFEIDAGQENGVYTALYSLTAEYQ